MADSATDSAIERLVAAIERFPRRSQQDVEVARALARCADSALHRVLQAWSWHSVSRLPLGFATMDDHLAGQVIPTGEKDGRGPHADVTYHYDRPLPDVVVFARGGDKLYYAHLQTGRVSYFGFMYSYTGMTFEAFLAQKLQLPEERSGCEALTRIYLPDCDRVGCDGRLQGTGLSRWLDNHQGALLVEFRCLACEHRSERSDRIFAEFAGLRPASRPLPRESLWVVYPEQVAHEGRLELSDEFLNPRLIGLGASPEHTVISIHGRRTLTLGGALGQTTCTVRLSGKLEGYDLTQLDFRQSDLSGVQLTRSLMPRDLSGARLSGATLRIETPDDEGPLVFDDADLSGARLGTAPLILGIGASFQRTDLRAASLSRVWRESRFVEADLCDADLRGVDLRRAHFRDCHLGFQIDGKTRMNDAVFSGPGTEELGQQVRAIVPRAQRSGARFLGE